MNTEITTDCSFFIEASTRQHKRRHRVTISTATTVAEAPVFKMASTTGAFIVSTAKITYCKNLLVNIIKMLSFFHETIQKFSGNLLLIFVSIFSVILPLITFYKYKRRNANYVTDTEFTFALVKAIYEINKNYHMILECLYGCVGFKFLNRIGSIKKPILKKNSK